MTRKEYIAGLEKIREQVKNIGVAFAAVDLTDATDMESERRKKTTKIVHDLSARLYEDIAISAKVAADKAEAGIGEQGDLFENAAAKDKPKTDKPKAEKAQVVEVKMLPAPKEEKPTRKRRGKKNGTK